MTNKLPIVTTLISLAAAIGLWLIAMWLEDDSVWLQSPEQTPESITGETVRPDSDLQTDVTSNQCAQVEDALQVKVSASQNCSTDDDCTLFDYGYPIQCLTSVAKSQITALRLAYRHYEQSCPYRVYYDCPTGDMQRQAVCRGNRCSVELQSNETLKEETLEYLGIDPR
jgi:hypothetical protein